MSEFNRDASIVGQNAGSTAAVLMEAFVGKDGYQGSLEDFLADYNVIRTDVMNGSVALAGAEQFIEAFGEAPKPQQRNFGGGGNRGGGQHRSSGGGAGKKDPATVELNFGKFRGRTLGDVLEEDPSYLEWLSTDAQNDFVRRCASELLAA